MTVITPGATHLAEYLLLLDAKDEPGLCRLMTSDVQHVNEITRRWTRGRAAVGAELRTMFSRLSDLRSTAEDVHVERWGDVEVDTFELHQVYDLEGGDGAGRRAHDARLAPDARGLAALAHGLDPHRRRVGPRGLLHPWSDTLTRRSRSATRPVPPRRPRRMSPMSHRSRR